MSDSRYRDALSLFYRLRRFGLRPGLEVVEALLHELGEPHLRYPVLHVAGSKGKGSVSALAAEVLSASGRRTGLFTSPHLQSFRERIQIDRAPITPGEVVDGLDRITKATRALERRGALERSPTFFETATVLAFDRFARAGVEAAVIEVGIGGRLDATNVVRGPVGVITTIELEHTEILGSTLREIAREKAGILKPGMRAVSAEPKTEPAEEIRRTARASGVPLWELDHEFRVGARSLSPGGQSIEVITPRRHLAALHVPLLGGFQARNAATAIAAVDLFAEAVGFPLPDETVRTGIGRTRWRGRLERADRRPDLYLDVAHTPESARALALGLGEISPLADPQGNVLVFGCLDGKRPAEMFEALGPLFARVVLVPVRSGRTLPVAELARNAEGRFPVIVRAPSVAAGLSLARAATRADGFTLVTGSDYLVGEVLDLLEGQPAEEPDLSDPVPSPAASSLPGPERRR